MRTSSISAAILLVAASALQAQGRGRNIDGIPPGQRPHAGMCRVWVDGLPPGQQPQETDCATAAAHVPSNGHLIYGSGTHHSQYTSRYTSSGIFTRTIDDANGNPIVQRVRRNSDGTYTVLSSTPASGAHHWTHTQYTTQHTTHYQHARKSHEDQDDDQNGNQWHSKKHHDK